MHERPSRETRVPGLGFEPRCPNGTAAFKAAASDRFRHPGARQCYAPRRWVPSGRRSTLLRPMSIAIALVAGAVLGGIAVLLLLRPILRERNEARAELRESERELAATKAQLASVGERSRRPRSRRDQGAVGGGLPRDERVVSPARRREAGRHRKAARRLAGEGERAGAGARPRACSELWRAPRAALDALVAHGDARDRAARATRARALGRDPAQARRRAGRDAAVLRLRGAGHHRVGHRPAAPRPDRAAPRRQAGRGRRQGVRSPPTSRRTRRPTTRRARASWPTMRGTCESTCRSCLRRATGSSSRTAPTTSSCSFRTRGSSAAAWEHDPELVELGVRNRVHIASPTTLIVLLQAIAFGWQQEKVAEDARTVHELGPAAVRAPQRHGRTPGEGRREPRPRRRVVQPDGVVARVARSSSTARELDKHVVSDKAIEQLPPVDVDDGGAGRARARRRGGSSARDRPRQRRVGSSDAQCPSAPWTTPEHRSALGRCL